MLSTCANPACRVPFHYLLGGKVYSRKPPGPDEAESAVEYFWLCGRCSQTLTVAICDLSGEVMVRELPPDRRRHAERGYRVA